jgi:hypothetical protein
LDKRCKIHAIASVETIQFLFTESMIITPAEDNYLTAFKQAWVDKNLFKCNKIYTGKEYFNENKRQTQDIEMLTPIKGIKGQIQEKQ